MEKPTLQKVHAEELEFLHGLYPELNTAQLLEVKERLDGYFDVILETFLESYANRSVDDDAVNS